MACLLGGGCASEPRGASNVRATAKATAHVLVVSEITDLDLSFRIHDRRRPAIHPSAGAHGRRNGLLQATSFLVLERSQVQVLFFFFL